MQAKKEAEMVQKIIEKVMMNFVSKYEIKMLRRRWMVKTVTCAGESGVQGAGGRCGQEGLHQALRCHQLDTSQKRRQGKQQTLVERIDKDKDKGASQEAQPCQPV